MTVTGVRWAESVNRKHNQGYVTVFDGDREKGIAEGEDFRKTKKGGVVLVNDNEESRRLVEACYKRRKTNINPIIDWEDRDVWDFIRSEKIPYCSLYDEGFHRLGCIGCPMAAKRERERDFRRWPKYKDAYMRAFDKMLQLRRERHEKDPSRPIWRQGGLDYEEPTAKDVFNWWMEYDVLPGQIDLFEDEED